MRKIAVCGSAPSSVALAPFGDKSWEIWGCSPGLWPYAKRVDAWFEIHNWDLLKARVSKEYIRFMAEMANPVYLIESKEEIPASIGYPIDRVLNEVIGWTVNAADGKWRERRFSRAYFASTISWMFALAIIERPDAIGLWGIDMSAEEEWIYQRSGIHSLIEEARSLGIEIVVPPQSDILRPPPLYGFCEIDPAWIKAHARTKELKARIADVANRGQSAQRELDYLRGAEDNQRYYGMTWIGNPFHMSQNYHTEVPPASSPPTTVAPSVQADGDWRGLEEKIDGQVAANADADRHGGFTVSDISTAVSNVAPDLTARVNGQAANA